MSRHLTSPITQVANSGRHHNEQRNLLKASSTNIRQNIKILNTVFKPRISYSSYAIPFSKLNMCKIDKILIKLTKTICKIPNNTTNILLDLNDDKYGINTTTILLDYITYISKTHPKPQ